MGQLDTRLKIGEDGRERGREIGKRKGEGERE